MGMTPQQRAQYIFSNIAPKGHRTLNNKLGGLNWIKKQYNKMPHPMMNPNEYDQNEINTYWKETERLYKLL